MPGGASPPSPDHHRAAFLVVAIFVFLLLAGAALKLVARPARVGDGGGVAGALRSQQLDLNRASAAELATLPGVGPTLARRIVEERAERGAFRSIDELERVAGIGPSLVERVRARSRVATP